MGEDRNPELERFQVGESNNHYESHKPIMKNLTQRRAAIIFGVLISIIVFLFIIIIFLMVRKAEMSKEPVVDICRTTGCKKLAQQIARDTNCAMDPCEDFYNFTCANWGTNHPMPKGRKQWSTFQLLRSEMRKKLIDMLENHNKSSTKSLAAEAAVNFYQACFRLSSDQGSEQFVRSLKEILTDLGGWPLLDQNWNEKADLYDWQRAYVSTDTKLGGINPFFELKLTDNGKGKVIEVDVADSIVFDPLDYTQDQQSATEAFRETVRSRVTLLQGNLGEGDVTTQINELIELDKELQQITKAEFTSDSNDTNFELTLTEANARYKEVNLLTIFQEIFRTADIVIKGDEKIYATANNYLMKLGEVLSKKGKRAVANYVGWMVVDRLGDFIFKDIKDANQLKNECFELSEVNFELPISYLYVRKFFSEEEKQELKHVMEGMKTALDNVIQETSWMDRETKKKAEQELNQINSYVATASWMMDQSTLDKEYEDLRSITSEYFMDAYKRVEQWKRRSQLKELRHPPKREPFVPSIVKIFFSPKSNRAALPTAILNPPFYHQELPDSMNFGSVGSVISHEIIYGFDLTAGPAEDKDHLPNWWSAKTKESLKPKAKCLHDQYSKFYEPKTKLQVRAGATLGNNIADNVAVYQAFKAYKMYTKKQGKNKDVRLPALMKSFTQDQLFFIAYARLWCEDHPEDFIKRLITNGKRAPSRFRVNGPLMNSEQFAAAFQCELGTPMNPKEKCNVWN